MEQHEIGTRKDLAAYRLKTAEEDLSSAELLLNHGDFRGANNRAYYAVFHAVSAVHALDGKAYKRHKDALGNFNKEYVKTEVFDRTIGRQIAELEMIRHASDYDDFFVASKEQAEEQVAAANKIYPVK